MLCNLGKKQLGKFFVPTYEDNVVFEIFALKGAIIKIETNL